MSKRCTQVVLESFGITGIAPKDGLGVLQTLQEHGWAYNPQEIDTLFFKGTLQRFIDTHPSGHYVLSTAGHSLALHDGVLIDSAHRTGRRKVRTVMRVYKNT